MEGKDQPEGSERFRRILDVLNQSDPAFRGRKRERAEGKQVKGRTMMVLADKSEKISSRKVDAVKKTVRHL
jgi:hypothetical protein